MFIGGKAYKRKQRPIFVHLVMQEPGYQLFSDSVLKEVESACGDSDAVERIHDVLERFGLLDLVDRHPLSLSGGREATPLHSGGNTARVARYAPR